VRVGYPRRDISYVAWQSKRHVHPRTGCSTVLGDTRIMADSESTRVSTAKSAYESATLADFETFLSTPFMGTQKNKETGKEEQVERLPSAPSVSANIPAEWMYTAYHHPLFWSEGRDYEDGIGTKVARFGVWLVMASANGALQVPKGVVADFQAWADQEAERVKAALSAARVGSGEVLRAYAAETKQLRKEATGLKASIEAAVAAGIMTREAADAVLAGASGQDPDAPSAALVPA
jgi:hypothetical protein